MYNNRLAFTSVAAKFKTGKDFDNSGTLPVVLHGQLHHKISTLSPSPGNKPAFAQIYVHDTDQELPNRLHFRIANDGSKQQEIDMQVFMQI